MVAQPGPPARPRPLPRPRRPPASPATCWSSTPPRRCPPRCPPLGQTARPSICTSPPRPNEPRSVGRRAAQRRAPRPGARRDADAARRRRGTAARALPEPEPPVDRAARPPRAAARLPAAPRRADPLRPRADRPPARGPPDDLRHRARQRGDAERRPPVHQARADRLRERGVSVQRIMLHTGVSSQERGERPYPERYAVSAHTAARVNAARAA